MGSALLASFLILILLPLEIGGNKIPWTDALIPTLFGAGVLCLVLFVLAEKWWTTNPLLPLNLFCKRHTVVSFLVLALQCAAQLGVSCMILESHSCIRLITSYQMMFSVPLYFQVTQKMSNTAAGAHLMPAVIGNAIGGIISGYFIRK